MLRCRRLAATFVVLVALTRPGTSLGEVTNCAGKMASQGQVASLVDSINDVALTQSSWSMLPWPLARNPFTDWYVRFVTAIGTDDSPTLGQRNAAVALIHQVASLPDVTVRASVWSNRRYSSFDDSAARAVRELCVDTVAGGWAMNEHKPSAVEPMMEDWLESRLMNVPMPSASAKNFVETLSSGATLVTARSSHPFNVLAALSIVASVGLPNDRVPSMTTVPYYDDEKVQGIELRSASHIALYLFTADENDLLTFISKFHGSTDPALNKDVPGYAASHWKAIQSRFKAQPVALTPIDFVVRGRQGFNPSLDAHSQRLDAFGTTISTPYNLFSGLSEAQMSLGNGHFSALFASGIEGTDAQKQMTYDQSQATVRPLFSLPSVLYYIVDEQNGLILSYGFQRSLR